MSRLMAFSALLFLAFLVLPDTRAIAGPDEPSSNGVEPPPWSPLPFPPDAIVDSAPMGYLGGSSHVTPAGDFLWNLAIWTSPGRSGAQPSLAISYSARGGSGNGPLGVGFSLSGPPEVRRCGSSIAAHGKTRGVEFTVNDRFCIDGTPLVAISGSYGEEGSEYRAERGGFDRIVFHEGATFSPSWFDVRAKDGRRLRYESLKVFRGEASSAWPYTIAPADFVDAVWVLAEEIDLADNRVVYHHAILPSPDPFAFEYVLESVDYSLRPGEVSGKRKVKLVYEDRPDPSFTWVSGVSFRSTKRLKAIALYAPNPSATELVGEYRFAYQTSTTTQRSLLRTITRCDGENACLWSKEFEWETSLRPDFFDPIDLGVQEYSGSFFLTQNDTGILVLDTDGDGKDEILYRTGPEYFLRRMDAGGTPLGERIWINQADTGFHDIFMYQSRAVDADGDGAVELWAAQPPMNWYKAFTFHSGTGQPMSTGTTLPAAWLSNGSATYFEALHFADLNADALPDMVQQVFVGPADSRWGVRMNEGGGAFQDPPQDTNVPAFCGNMSRVIDANGDGRAEIWSASTFDCDESTTMGLSENDQPGEIPRPGLGFAARSAVWADLNGDGLREAVSPSFLSSSVRWNTGAGYGPKEALVNGPLLDGNSKAGIDQGLSVVDLNSDGKEDILAFRYTPSQKVIAYLSLGDGSFNPIAVNTWPGEFHDFEGFSTSRTGDFNGDSLIDAVVVGQDGRFRVLVQKPGQVDVVRSIRDVAGKEPSDVIHYSHAWSDAPEPASCAFPQRCMRHGIPVVREHWEWQGAEVGQYRKTLYDYQDPRVDLQGRGFLGFSKVRVRDAERPSETTLTFDHGKRVGTVYPEAGLPKTVMHVAPIFTGPAPSLPATVPARVTRVENAYQLELFGQGDPRFVVHPSEWSSDEWEQDVLLKTGGVEVPYDPSAAVKRHRSGSFEFDEYGNVTKAVEETAGGVRRVVETTYDTRHDDWLISLPETMKYLAIDVSPTSIGGAKHVPEPREVHYVYDDRGLLETVKVEPGALDPKVKRTTTFERNDDGLVTKITSEAPGETTQHVYISYEEQEGIFPNAVWNDLGYLEKFAFHPAYGVLAASQDWNGVETRTQHDGFARLRRVERDGEAGVDVFSSVALKNGWVAGLVEHVQSDAGDASYTVFDQLGRPVEEAVRAFDGQWSRSAITYDLSGRTKSVTRPELGVISPNKTTYAYDTLDRTLSVQAPDGSMTAYTHEFFKLMTSELNVLKNTLVFDVEGRVEQSIDRVDGIDVPTTFVYGHFDLIRNVIDPAGNITSMNYDTLGRRTSLIDPDRGVVITTYNGFDEVVSEENALGQVTSYKRDILRRVVEQKDVDGTTSFVWSTQSGRVGLLESTTSPDGTKTEHLYDSFSRPTTSTWTVNGKAYALTRAYDPQGRVKAIQYPEVPNRARFSIELTYTPHNDLATIRDPASPGLPFWTVQGRNADGSLTRALTGNGLLQKRSYQPLMGRLDILQIETPLGQVLDAIKHTYFTNGNLKTRTDSVKGRAEEFGYDDLERLTSWKLDTAAGKRETSYHYDLLGNLEKVFENSQLLESNTYGTNGRPHALTSTKQSSYGYDDIGRIIQGGGREIQYSAFDLPRTILRGGEATELAYDAFQRRVRKSSPGGSSVYIAELYEQREKNGTREHIFYIPGEFGPVAEVHRDEKTSIEKTLYLHGDALASTRFVTDAQGNEVERLYFEPFGQRVEYDGSPTAQGYTPATEIGLTGFHYDDDLGLINARGRIYDPALKRFMTPDPIVAFPLFSQAYNRFSFTLNNPLRFVDPTGFTPQDGAPGMSAKAPANLDPPRRASPPPRPSSAGNAKPRHGGANGPAPQSSDASGHETPSGPRAPAVTPPSSAPPAAAEASPITAAPVAAPSVPAGPSEPAPPVGPPPPASTGGGGTGGALAPQSWRDNPVAQIVGGYMAGLALGVVPGGGIGGQVLTGAGVLASGTRPAQIGRAVGETMGGVILMVVGAGGSLGGGFISLSGVGAAVGVPAAAVSAGLITAGAGNVMSGLAGLGRALSTGSGSGGQGPVHHSSTNKAHGYPNIADPRTGKPIPFPEGVTQKAAKSARPSWGPKERGAYISEWYRRGYATPEGGWDKYDIHHIIPREYGGTNDFWNLVPVTRGSQHELFNSFWRQFAP